MGHLSLVILSGIFLSGYFAGVDAAIGGNCPGGDGDCTAGNHEVCSTDVSPVCICADGYTDNSGTCGCGDPSVSDATIALAGGATATNEDDTATVTCVTGYEVSTGVATATITCLADGSWDALPTCSKKVCPVVSHPANGATTLDSGGVLTYQATATVTCNAGYEVSDGVPTATITCQADGSWEALPTCNAKVCPAVSHPANGATTLDSGGVLTYQATATVTCDAGYEVSGGGATATITCQADGTWEALPTCNKKDCGAATVADGTTVLDPVGVTTYGATGTVTCDAGFGLSTDTATHAITCQAAGSWSALPTCTAGAAADCGAPSPPANGAILTAATANTEGHEATVACDTGYALDGASTMTCQHDDTWSTPGTCSDCGAVSDPADGTTTLDSTGVMTVGATATVTCNTGFELSTGAATATITCQADASWSTLPTCNAGPISVTWSFSVLLLLGVMTRLMKE